VKNKISIYWVIIVFAIGFFISWGSFQTRVGALEDKVKENSKVVDKVKDDLAEMKGDIKLILHILQEKEGR